MKYSVKAGLTMKKMTFSQEEEEEEESLKALGLEHFYLPLLLWTAGLGLSALSFIVEIIVKPRGQRRERERWSDE